MDVIQKLAEGVGGHCAWEKEEKSKGSYGFL